MAKATEADPRETELAALREMVEMQGEQIARMLANQKAGAVNAVEAQQDAKSKAETEALRKEVEKGNVLRTQEEADRRYTSGAKVFQCVLKDGNGHPEIRIRADNEVDAGARYRDVCGINSAEKPTQVAAV